MPDYLKRGIWLRRVAYRLNDEVLAAILETYAERMIGKADLQNKVRMMNPE